MAYKVNTIVATVSPNLYAAAQQANLDPQALTQIEQFSWSVKKNKQFAQLDKETARAKFLDLDKDAQEKIKFLYPDANYVQEDPTAMDAVKGVLVGGAKIAASPLLALFKTLGAYTRAINTPYLMARQAAQGEDLFSKKTFTDAWDGRRIYDEGALSEATKYFGSERVKVAQGLIAGLKPGQIIEEYGKVDEKLLKAFEEAFNDPDSFKQVLDGVKYAQVSLGRDIARMFDTKPVSQSLNLDYIDGRTKNISGTIDFFYQLLIDPLTYLTLGASKIPGVLNKSGTLLAQRIAENGSKGVIDVFRESPDVVKLWDQQLGPKVKELIDAEPGAAKEAARRTIKEEFRGYNNDEAIKMLEENKLTDASRAMDYFSKVENTVDLLSGRVDGIQYFRNGIATSRNQRRLDFGMGRYIQRAFNPASADTFESLNKLGDDAWDTLTTIGKDGELYSPAIDDFKNFYDRMPLRQKIAQKFSRSPQGQLIFLGEKSIKTADNFRNTARQVLPKDLADFVTYKFINSPANDQVVILRNLFVAVMQRYGLDGHPLGKELMETTLKSKFGDREGMSILSELDVPMHMMDDISKVGLKLKDNAATLETSGAIHPFQEAGAIASLDYVQMAQTLYNIRTKKNLIQAVGGATQSKFAAEFVNFWSLFTLFPRLGVRSAIDEGLMFFLTAPAREIFDYFKGTGRKMGKVATAHTGKDSAEGVTYAIKKALGGKTASKSITVEDRQAIRAQIAKSKNITEDMVTNLDLSYGIARRAQMLYGRGLDEQASEFIIQALAHHPMVLQGASRSISSAANITGRADREIAEELITPNNYDMMLKDLDLVSGGKGTIINTTDLAQARILGGRGVAVVHFENFIKRFYGNARALDGETKRVYDPARNFLQRNGLKTKEDFANAKDDALLSIGIERNKIVTETVGEDGVKLLEPKLVYKIVDEKAVDDFLTMSSRSSELAQRNVDKVDIVVDQVDRTLVDMYNTFHGAAGKYNDTLYNLVSKEHAKLIQLETESLKPIADKWHIASKSLTFDMFEEATQGFQPVGRMFTGLDIEGFVDAESALARLGNNMFEIMDKQVTGIFRQPVMMLAYTRIRKNLYKLELEQKDLALKAAIKEMDNPPTGWKLEQLKDDINEIIERRYVNIATQQAADTVLKYADNPNIRSNFALQSRNVARFYRATEDFWRRTIRLRDNSVRALYRTRLMHMGMNNIGIIHNDSKGDPYIVMPMDDIIYNTINGTVMALTGKPDAFKTPLFNDFTLKLKLANPSFSPDAGMPTLSGPIAALSIIGMKNILGNFGTGGKILGEELDTFALGDIGDNIDIVRALVPSSIIKAYAILPVNEKSSQETTAVMQAIAYNAARGNILDPNASDIEKYEFMKSMRISAHNIIAMRAVLGLLSPIAPTLQESKDLPSYLREVGITGLRPEFYDLVNAVTKTYSGDVQDPYEMALATFVGDNPNKLVYTVSRDERTTNVILNKSKNLKNWVISNENLIDTYGEAAFIFAPHVGDFDAGTYAYLEAAGFQQSKSVEKYYNDVLVAKDKQAYYDIARKEKEDLNNTTSISERRAIIEVATSNRARLKASNPLLNTALTAGGNEIATEEKMLDSLQQILINTDVPMTSETRNKMLIITSQIKMFVDMSNNPEARQAPNFTELKRESKARIEAIIADFADGDLNVKEANRSVFRSILDYYSRDTYTAFRKGF